MMIDQDDLFFVDKEKKRGKEKVAQAEERERERINKK